MEKEDLMLSVVVVSHGHESMLRGCIDSLLKAAKGITTEITVIDNLNGNKDTCLNEDLPDNVRVIENEQPHGYAWNVNKGASESNGQYLLVLNPDTLHESGMLADALEFMESRKRAGILGCGMINEDGSKQQNFRPFPTLQFVLARGLGIGEKSWRPKFYKTGMMEGVEVKKAVEVDWVTGAFMLMKREVYDRLGGMDVAFPLYYEDVDLCMRSKKMGLVNYVFPELCFKHMHIRTSAKEPFGLHWRWHVKSIIRYFFKHRYLWKVPEFEGIEKR